MQSIYILTFFTHFGASSFYKHAVPLGLDVKMMSLPRALSSDCGTCVRLNSDSFCDYTFLDLQGVYKYSEKKYIPLFIAD